MRMLALARARALALALAAGAALAACVTAAPRSTPEPANAPVPARTFTVEVTGSGPPMVLIPGLACSGAVWDSVVEHYRNRYRIHVLTIKGFVGEPAASGSAAASSALLPAAASSAGSAAASSALLPAAASSALLPAVERDLASYLREQALSAPVIIGHSLGGFLALSLAADEPALLGAATVISVDGLPFLGALFDPSATAEGNQPQARAMRDQLAASTPEQYAMQSRASLAMMIKSPEVADRVAKDSGRSDPRTVGEAMYEVLTTDLRPRLPAVRAKTLLIGAGALVPEAARAQVAATYEGQIAAIPNHRFVLAQDARHFVMLDDPAFFFRTVDEFLEARTGGGNLSVPLLEQSSTSLPSLTARLLAGPRRARPEETQGQQ